jgi:pantothenate synthetase
LIKVEYLTIVNGKTLEPVDIYQENTPNCQHNFIAAKVGQVRLIDNVILQK